MPMNYFYSFYMKCTNSGGWWWQWCLLLPYVKHLNILIKVAIIWLILPVYFLKVCLRKVVWNDVISNKTWILPSDISVCFISRPLRENCWCYNCSDLQCKMYHPARNGAFLTTAWVMLKLPVRGHYQSQNLRGNQVTGVQILLWREGSSLTDGADSRHSG